MDIEKKKKKKKKHDMLKFISNRRTLDWSQILWVPFHYISPIYVYPFIDL